MSGLNNDINYADDILSMLDKLAWSCSNDKFPLLEFYYNHDRPEDSFFDCCGTNNKCSKWSLETAIEHAYNEKFGNINEAEK